MRKTVRNAKPLTPKTLRQVIRNSLKKTALTLDGLTVNGGNITIKKKDNTPYQFGRTNVIFTVSVQTKKFSFKTSKTKVTSAIVDFDIIAVDCFWHEGIEAYVWDGDKDFRMHVDEETIHVVTQFRDAPLNITKQGEFFTATDLEFFDDIGIAVDLAVTIKNNTSNDTIRSVLEYALANCFSLDDA